MSRSGVICGGSCCVDRNRLIEWWPEEDGTTNILSEEMQGGGSCANMAVDLKRLGAPFPVEAIALVGDDEDGRFLIDLFDGLGIERSQVRVSPTVPTAVTHVMSVKPTGRRTFFYRPGTADAIDPDAFYFSRTNA